MTEAEANTLLYQLNPIISAQANERILKVQKASGVTEMTPGYGVDYLRFADAVDAVGWAEVKRLSEVQRLYKELT